MKSYGDLSPEQLNRLYDDWNLQDARKNSLSAANAADKAAAAVLSKNSYCAEYRESAIRACWAFLKAARMCREAENAERIAVERVLREVA